MGILFDTQCKPTKKLGQQYLAFAIKAKPRPSSVLLDTPLTKNFQLNRKTVAVKPRITTLGRLSRSRNHWSHFKCRRKRSRFFIFSKAGSSCAAHSQRDQQSTVS